MMDRNTPHDAQLPAVRSAGHVYQSHAPMGYPGWAPARPSQLIEYWQALRGQLALLGVFAILGALAGFGFAWMQHPLYRARAVLDIQSLNPSVLSMHPDAGTNTNPGIGLPDAYLQTEIKLLQSESILKRAVSKTVSKTKQTEGDRALSFAGGLIRVPKPEKSPLTVLIGDASQRVKVRALGNTRIVEIICDARDGQVAAGMCNNLAEAYIEHNLEARQQSTQQTGDWLGSQLDNVRKRLSQSESQLRDLARDSSVAFSSEFANPAQENLRQLQGELSRAQAMRIGKQSEYEVLLNSGPDALPISLDAGPIRDYRMRLTELRRQHAELSATMKPEHYKVRELDAQITSVGASLGKEREDLLTRLRTDFDSAERREKMLAKAYTTEASALSAHGDQAVLYQMLKRDVDSGRRLYEVLLQKVEEVGLAAAMRTSTISIVDKATPSVVPYSPNWMASIGIGFFGAACMGMGVGLVRSRSDRTLRHPGETAGQLNVRELGVIPSSPRSRRRLKSYLRIKPRDAQEKANDEKGQLIVHVGPSHGEAAALHSEVLPHVAEAFCGTMDSLLFASGALSSCQVVVVTSPEKGDGKTTVSTNLAATLARTNRRVVIVDGDLRQPRLKNLFELPTELGLSALLTDQASQIENDSRPIALPTHVNNLFAIPTASVPDSDVTAMLHSKQLALLIARLRRDFDVVLIDTPPMLPVSDARVLGALADWVLLVLRAGKTTRETAAHARQCLSEDGTRVVGTVLNDWDARKTNGLRTYSTPYVYSRTA